MNKKILFGAALIGLMGFASCVDDTESASVTAVRQAKAEQMKALATLSSAQAEAARLNAETAAKAQAAEQAYKEAEAKKLAAEQALVEAQIATENAKTEQEKALAEQQKAQALKDLAYAQYLQEKYANDIKELESDLELKLLQNKNNIAQQEKELLDKIQAADDAKAKRLSDLLDAYSEAQTTYVGKQNQLTKKQIRLAQLEAGLITAKEALQKQLDDQNEALAEAETTLDEYKAQLEAYQTSGGVAEVKAQLEDAKKEASSLKEANDEAYYKWSLAYNAAEDAKNAVYKTEYATRLSQRFVPIGSVDFEWDPGFMGWYFVQNYGGAYEAIKPGKEPIKLFKANELDEKQISYTYNEGEQVLSVPYSVMDENFMAPEKDGVANIVKAIQAEIDAKQGQAVTDAKEDVKTQEGVVKEKQTALDEAKKAVTDAGENVTQDLKDAVTTAEGDLATEKTNLETAQQAQADAEEALATVQKDLADLKEALESTVSLYSTIAPLEEAYNSASENEGNEHVAYDKANNAYSVAVAKVRALENIYYSGDPSDIENAISALETKIDAQEVKIQVITDKIAELEEELASDGDPDTLETIANLKDQIAQDEAELPTYEKLADMAKAQLEAAMAE